MIRIHVLHRTFLNLDDLSRVLKTGHDIISLEVGGASKPAIEVRRHNAQSPEREVAEAGIELRFRMAGEKPPPYPQRVGPIAFHLDESAENGEPRMGERIAFSGRCEQHGSTWINLDIGRVSGQPRHQNQGRAVRIGRHIYKGGKRITGVAVDSGKGSGPRKAQQFLSDGDRIKV